MKVPSLFFTLLAAASIHAAEFHVSPKGNDRNSGSAEAPWQTLDKVNRTLKPGDTAVFRPGRYAGFIHPARSGEKDRPITYRSAEKGQAVLLGGHEPAVEDSRTAILLNRVEYIVVDGFSAEVPSGCSWMRVLDSRYCTVQNLELECGQVYSPVNVRNSHYCRFLNLRMQRGLNLNRESGMVQCDLWNNYRSSHNIYDGLYITKFGHRPLGFDQHCDRMVIRNCVFDGRWGRNFEFFSTTNVLFENCVITNAYDGSNSADGRAKIFLQNSIFRRNAIFRNWSAPLVFNSYKDKYFEDITHVMKDNRIYHNTFHHNNDAGIEFYEYWGKLDYPTIHHNVLVNNIFSDTNADGSPCALFFSGSNRPIEENNRFIANLLGQSAKDKVVYFRLPQERYFTVREVEKEHPAMFSGNYAFAPGFVDVDRDDYRLKPDSRAIEQGAFLTTAGATGRGSELPVKDAGFFYDGFGIPGETGDLIMVGRQKQQARVVKRDREKNLLLLDREIAFAAGDPVSLAYHGKAPDLGAYEFGLETGPRIPAGIRMETMATATGPVIFTDFEPENRENWFYVWSYTRQQDSTAQVDYTQGAGGSKGSYRVYATGDKSTLSTYLVPADWSVARFPLIRFDYKIPAGVPVGLAVSAFDREGRQNFNLYLGGSPGYDAGGAPDLRKYQLIADGQWHEITLDLRILAAKHPELKMIKRFRFRTNGNGKKDDQFWIDNFKILPLEK